MITRILSITIAVAGLAIATAQSATLTINANAGYRTGQGGEFTIVPAAGDAVLNNIMSGYNANALFGGSPTGFETFCIEFNETFSPGSTYVYGISSGAISGGVSGGNPDPISKGTAWLYTQFATGVLTGLSATNTVVAYDYVPGAGRSASAGLLQNAIWWLEGEIADPGNTNPFRNKVMNLFGATATDTNTDTDLYPVAALNLFDSINANGVGTGLHQDQLVYQPRTGRTNVPEGGASVVLMGLALTGLGVLRRKLG